MKKCSRCGDEKSLDEFDNRKDTNDGKSYICKICSRIRVREHRQKFPKKYLLSSAKNRAKKKGIPFDLELEDIFIPELCPVFKKPFVYGLHKQDDFSMTLDRINNTKGYLKDNIVVVSMKANRIKNDATIEELEILTNFYKLL